MEQLLEEGVDYCRNLDSTEFDRIRHLYLSIGSTEPDPEPMGLSATHVLNLLHQEDLLRGVETSGMVPGAINIVLRILSVYLGAHRFAALLGGFVQCRIIFPCMHRMRPPAVMHYSTHVPIYFLTASAYDLSKEPCFLINSPTTNGIASFAP
jgi:hypothetical protein